MLRVLRARAQLTQGHSRFRLSACAVRRFSVANAAAPSIPTIDLLPFLPSTVCPDAQAAALDQLRYAAHRIGFFFVKNTPLHLHPDPHFICKTLDTSRNFLTLPEDYKSRCRTENSQRGYHHFISAAGEQDRIEAFTMGREVPDGRQLRHAYHAAVGLDTFQRSDRFASIADKDVNRWPDASHPVSGRETAFDPKAFRHLLLTYYDACAHTSSIILTMLARALRVDPAVFVSAHSKADCTLEAKLYPSLASVFTDRTEQIRFQAHSDMSSITLLVQDRIGGLEVFNEDTQSWLAAVPDPSPSSSYAQPNASSSVQPPPSTVEPASARVPWHPLPQVTAPGHAHRTNSEFPLLVNTGDLMEAWSAGVFPSTRHRVKTDAGHSARVSLVYFAIPDWDAEIKSQQVAVSAEEQQRLVKRYGPSGFLSPEPGMVGDRMPLGV